VLVLAGLGAASPPPAPAATTIGQLDPGTPSSACTGSSYWVQSVTSGPGYAIPAGGGVITSWSHKANVVPDRELGLRVFRPLGGTSYSLIGTSGVQVLAPSAVNTFATRIPVQAGDLLGLYVGNPGLIISGGASCAYAALGNTVNYSTGFDPEPAVGSSVSLTPHPTPYALNATAKLEPDADADGYGDETQDGCPTSGTSTGACSGSGSGPGPDRTAPKGAVKNRRDSLRDRSLSVTVVSNEAASVVVSATVRLAKTSRAKTSRVFGLRSASSSLTSNLSKRIQLRLPRKARKPIRRRLKHRKKLEANVTVVLKDAAGNSSTVKAAMRLRK
jgi:hypothetical protein